MAPNWRLGPRLARCTCRIDFFRNSTDDCLSCQANSVRKRIFQIFPPTLEQNSPTLDQNRPTLEQNRLTLYQNPPTLYQNFFFTKPDPATLVQIDLPWSKIQLPCTRKFFFTKFNRLPWTKINLPYTELFFHQVQLSTLDQISPTLDYFFLPSPTAYPTPPDQLQGR